MKILIAQFQNYAEVSIRDNGTLNIVYTFQTIAEAKAFATGFEACRQLACRLVQQLPSNYQTAKGFNPE